MTVAELKQSLASWPEVDAAGDPTEVWIETGHQLSGPCHGLVRLNTGDLLLFVVPDVESACQERP